MVTEVMDGPSKEAGIQAGDVILEFDGGDVADSHMLVRRVAEADVGGSVDVVVFRDARRDVSVTLGSAELAEANHTPAPEKPAPEPDRPTFWDGSLPPLPDALRVQFDLPAGLTRFWLSGRSEQIAMRAPR